MSCSWPTADTTGTGHAATARTTPLVRERQQVLEAAAAAGEDDDVDAARAQIGDRGRDRRRRARPLNVGLGDDDVRGREALDDRRQHVALGGRVVSGDEADEARYARQRPLPIGGEEPLGGELLLPPLERGQVGAQPEPLDRQRAQPEVAPLLEELRAAEDVDALAVDEIEPERVELPSRHLDAETRAVLRILEREEHRRPPRLAAQLRHLALDPDRRQPLEPPRDAAVERTHGVDLAAVDLRGLDLRPGHCHSEA